MKITIEEATVWRSGNSYVITIPNAKDKGLIEGWKVKGELETIEELKKEVVSG